MDRQQVTSLTLLDLSAAFDTIDHSILLHRHTSWFGICVSALDWFRFYLSDRSFSVSCSANLSSSLPLTCGVPQGSVLGPILFIMYTTPLSTIISQSSPCGVPSQVGHLYADDTQLFISFQPTDASTALNNLHATISAISEPRLPQTAPYLSYKPSVHTLLISCHSFQAISQAHNSQASILLCCSHTLEFYPFSLASALYQCCR